MFIVVSDRRFVGRYTTEKEALEVASERNWQASCYNSDEFFYVEEE